LLAIILFKIKNKSHNLILLL